MKVIRVDSHGCSDINTEDVIKFYQKLFELEQFSLQEIFSNLKGVDVLFPQEIRIENIMRKNNIQKKFKKLLATLIDSYVTSLSANLKCNKDYTSFENCQYISSPAKILEELIPNYIKYLEGKKNILNILLKGDVGETLNTLYSENIDVCFFNNLLAAVLVDFVFPNYEKHKKLSVLELGAGIGSLTKFILPTLKEDKYNCIYEYTDISKFFLIYGKRNFLNNYPFLSFSLLNIDNISTLEIHKDREYNLILASNVLHVSKSILNALTGIYNILSLDGFLVINEGITKRLFTTLLYGLTDGWWSYEDDEYRIKGSALINRENWKILLARVGFKHITFASELYNLDGQLCQDIIIAHK